MLGEDVSAEDIKLSRRIASMVRNADMGVGSLARPAVACGEELVYVRCLACGYPFVVSAVDKRRTHVDVHDGCKALVPTTAGTSLAWPDEDAAGKAG